MHQEYDLPVPKEADALYPFLARQLASLLAGERNAIANLANASALLFGALENVNWAGFYLRQGEELILGPFQGKPACIRIPLGRGVCGTAAKEGRTQRVPDVHAFPGHIACDSASRSEMVVPILAGGQVVAVLDLDSPLCNRFEEADQRGLERLAQMLGEGCDW